MDAFLGRHSSVDLVVTNEASAAVDVEVGVVAVLAAVGVLESLVGGAQRSGEVDIGRVDGTSDEN
jgi:hypothetical protein